MTVHIENSFMSYDPERAKSTLAALIEESVHYANCRFKVGMSYDPIHRVFGVSTRNGFAGGPRSVWGQGATTLRGRAGSA